MVTIAGGTAGRSGDVCDPIAIPAETAAPRRKRPVPIPDDVDEGVLAALKAWRSTTAKAQGVPAYVIAKDATLHAIAATRPTTPDALAALPGVGPAFMERHAAAVLDLLDGGEIAA